MMGKYHMHDMVRQHFQPQNRHTRPKLSEHINTAALFIKRDPDPQRDTTQKEKKLQKTYRE